MNTSPKDLKRELFVRHYLVHLNISQAYKKAGFSPNDANAHRYFHRDDVQATIHHLAEKTLQKLDINVEKILKHLAAIAYGNALDVMEFKDDSWRFKELHELPPWVGVTLKKFDKQDNKITYAFEPKIPALQLLLKYLALRKKSQKKHNIVVNI